MSTKQEYKFFGQRGRIETVSDLDRLGQSVWLEPDVALDAARGGLAIIPAEDYNRIGFTAQEERDFSTPADVTKAPHEHHLKRDAALQAFLSFRAGASSPLVPATTRDLFEGHLSE